jgi:fibronectin-binding autotransporter adhesin
MFAWSAAMLPASAAIKTWDGGGADDLWLTGANWNANTVPVAGDSLIFVNNARLNNTNNFAPGTGFSGIIFNSPAGAYVLSGNSISLDGNITNNQPLVTETINLSLSLSGTRTVQVVDGAATLLGGVVSGGFGLTKTGPGLLTLGAANTLSGPVSSLGGVVSISSDGNLGTVPGAVTPGNLVLNGGALRSTANLTLNANRGIAVGPTVGSGSGRIEVNSGTTLTYSGVIANNGGTGGLTKAGAGTLTISSANTYTGPTSNRVGALVLDFTQAASPVNNVIASSSALSLGGENAGVGTVNNIQVTMNGKAATVNSQTFNGASFDVGHSTLRANSGAGGTANLILGNLGHLPGGVVTFTPPTLNAGVGGITTTSTNVNGILGGWATISSGAQVVNSIPVATNYASVNGGGNIVPYTGFLPYASGNIATVANAQSNLIFNTSGGFGSSVRVDVDHTPGNGTVTDINTLTINAQPNFGINIGSNNTLRLGKFGAIFLSAVPSTANINYEIGNGTTATGSDQGANAGQNVGTLTAGGAPNTDGELVFMVNSTSQTGNGSIYVETAITDNGSGKVSVIKTGPGPMKLRGHNSFSGNMYILQGRIQMAGAELSNPDSEGANPDAFGRGDIYVLPGGQAFPSGAGGNASMPAITNNWFLAGNGVSDNVGAIRFPGANGVFSNAVMTLIGDTRLGGGTFATGLGGQLYNKITGNFNLDFGATGNSGGGANGAILFNSANDWTGNTSIVGRTGSGGNTRLLLGNHNVIPDGVGKGNLILGNTGNNNNSQCVLDLNGFNETVNGLVSFAGNEAIQFIENRAASTTATLTVGNADVSASFGGTIQDNGGVTALTKIGGGQQTLYGANTYTGPTTVNAGALAISGVGSIASSAEVRVNSGAVLDVSGSSGFTLSGTLRLNGGSLVSGSAYDLNIPTLAMTNSELTVVVDPARENIVATSLTTGGPTNLINISAVVGISGYPAQFTIINYTGPIGGAGNNFGLGEVPNANTIGYVSNDVANARIVLVLLDGPKPLTWTGTDATSPTIWDLDTTTNWLAFKGTVNEVAATFNTADATLFDDTGATGDINLVGALSPGGVTVNNTALNYTFANSGALAGLGGLTKQGSGSLTLLNTGVSGFSGGMTVEGGSVIIGSSNQISGGVSIATGASVQVGTNGNSGNLPSGTVNNEGSVTFNRGSAAYTVSNKIGGNGNITKNDTAVLTLSGVNNTLTGAVAVVSGTLKAGAANALGTADGSTTISSGATLDVNDIQLNTEPVIVGGAGVGSAGAIINSAAAGQLNAMGNVTLTGDTTFGGTGRWDIRGGLASLSTGGNAYNLTKVGNNQISIVGVTVDSALANINVNAGIFAAETGTTSLGNPASTLTVASGATFQLFGNTVTLDKVFVLNGNGQTNTINSGSGSPVVQGATTISGNTIFNVGGTSLTWNGAIGGSGTLRKTGGSILTLGGNNTYTGNTTNAAGTLVLVGLNTGGGNLTNFPGATLAARGSHTGAIQFGTNATFHPGGALAAGTISSGALLLNNSVLGTDLGFANESFTVTNDVILVTGNLTLAGLTTNIVLAGFVGAATNDQVINVIQYTGTLTGGTNNLRLIAPPGYTMTYVDPSTTPGAIQLKVISAPATLTWRSQSGVNPTFWDISTTANWLKNGANSTFTNFDAAIFDDTALGGTVNLTTTLQPGFVTMNNNALAYTFTGTGKLTGPMNLDVSGGGSLIIANSGSNDFTGPIRVTSGLLQVGNGGADGNLGSGAITNDHMLAFNRSGTLNVSGGIHGGGNITNLGSGVTTVSGASTYSGELHVTAGTVRAGSGTALGNVLGGTFVQPSATLDVGGQVLNIEPVTVSGSGVGGQGAIYNSGPDQLNAMGNVTLAGHTTFGGTARWDIRGSAQTLSTSGNAYNLTKVGTNQFTLVAVLVDPALANIDVQAGTFSIETTTSSLGNPANTFTLAAGATFQMFNHQVPIDKVFLLNGNGVANTLNVSSGTLNTLSGPITLGGAGLINITAANALTATGLIGGSGSVTKTGTGSLTLANTLSYAGNTTLTGGSVFLTGTADLTSSPVITLGAGTLLDVTGLFSGPTLSLASGQTLQGSGTINGALSVAVGATVAPGASAGTLTVTNDITLAGVTAMEVHPAINATDLLRSITGNITYGGALTVTNIGGLLTNGASFKLFNAASYLGSFSSIQLPGLGIGQSWNISQLSVSGTISVVGNPAAPSISSVLPSGGNLIISGAGGVTNGFYSVVSSTDVAAPIATWAVVGSGQFNGNGQFSTAVAIDLLTPQRFFTIRMP